MPIGACILSRGPFFVEEDREFEAKECIGKSVVDGCLSDLYNERLLSIPIRMSRKERRR